MVAPVPWKSQVLDHFVALGASFVLHQSEVIWESGGAGWLVKWMIEGIVNSL